MVADSVDVTPFEANLLVISGMILSFVHNCTGCQLAVYSYQLPLKWSSYVQPYRSGQNNNFGSILTHLHRNQMIEETYYLKRKHAAKPCKLQTRFQINLVHCEGRIMSRNCNFDSLKYLI